MGPSAVSDVEASKMAVPASAGPMSRVSEWRFEGPFRSDAKMFIAGPLATFVVGLVGYALVSAFFFFQLYRSLNPWL